MARRGRGGRSTPLRSIASRVERLLSLALVVGVLLGSAPAVQALFRCKAMARVAATCCCPSSRETTAPALSRSSCCERVGGDQGLPTGSRSADPPPLPAPTFAVVLASLPLFPSYPAGVATLPSARPWVHAPIQARAGPMLCILQQRFLI